MKDALSMFVITTGTKDYGERFVVREHRIGAEGVKVAAFPLAVVDTLESARVALHRSQPGLVCLGRDPSDDPVIVESWL